MKDANVHDPKYREAKPPQSNASVPVSQLFRLDNRTIIVTGATGFLGTTVAKAIVESGGDVIGLDLVPEPTSQAWSKQDMAGCPTPPFWIPFVSLAAHLLENRGSQPTNRSQMR